MTKVPAKMMREFVRRQNFTATEDIIVARILFKNVSPTGYRM